MMDTRSLNNFDHSLQIYPYGFLSSYLRPARLEHKKEITRDRALSAAVIFSPVEGDHVPGDNIVVEGVALAGIGKELWRVELSVNGGQTWLETEISDYEGPDQWRRWRKRLELTPRWHQLAVRTVDRGEREPQSDFGNTWHWVAIKVV